MSTTTESHAVSTVSVSRLITFGVLAAIVACVVNLLLRGAAIILFDVPAGYGPFGVGPVTTTTLIGVVGATGVFGVLIHVSKRPIGTFLGIGAAVLVISFLPLLAPPTFLAGAPPSVLGTLGIMHVTTAVIAVGAMLWVGNNGDYAMYP